MERKLGQCLVTARNLSRPYLKVSQECVYEISLLDSLHAHLKEPHVFEEVLYHINLFVYM